MQHTNSCTRNAPTALADGAATADVTAATVLAAAHTVTFGCLDRRGMCQ